MDVITLTFNRQNYLRELALDATKWPERVTISRDKALDIKAYVARRAVKLMREL